MANIFIYLFLSINTLPYVSQLQAFLAHFFKCELWHKRQSLLFSKALGK